jgi:hypothetical protein
MSVEQRELLMAVDDVAGVVNVERDGCGLARIAIGPNLQGLMLTVASFLLAISANSALPRYVHGDVSVM